MKIKMMIALSLILTLNACENSNRNTVSNETSNKLFCLAKDSNFPSSVEHIARMKELGVSCATVYWKLNAKDNRKNPYAWIRRKYLDLGYSVVMPLIIDDGSSTVALGENSDSPLQGNLSKVVDGHYDQALEDLAKAVAKDGRPVKIRPFHEFNGRWFPWAMYVPGNSVELLVEAFEHVTEIFADAGASNVTFDANVNRRDANQAVLANAEKYIPALDKLVGSISISTYGRGGTIGYPDDKSFREEFLPVYNRLLEFTDKPINVAEVSSTGILTTKISWFEEMFKDIDSAFPRIKEITFFFGKGETLEGGSIDWDLEPQDYDYFSTLLKKNREK